MHGNVWEWCSDWLSTYSTTAQTNPTGALTGTSRIVRGGGWSIFADYCRSADRFNYFPTGNDNCVGFRLAFAP
jgi:formylglycine-generating enzyme required for sulfatase activity